MKPGLTLVVVLFLFGAGGRASADPEISHADSFSREGFFKANVAELKDTRLVAHPGVPLAPGQNVLWCGTLQLAWNEAIGLVGEKLRFDRQVREVDLLNRMDFTRQDLAPGSYVAVADFEVNHVEDEIRAALEKTFHGAASPELIPDTPTNPGPEDFVAYAYLYKNLAFATPFADMEPLAFDATKVETFGFNPESHLPEKAVRQVGIYDYQSRDNFIIELKTKSADDDLILAKIQPSATLEDTIRTVLTRLAQHAPEFPEAGDLLMVPKLNFDLRRRFSELEGLTLEPSSKAKIKDKLVISRAEQLVRFQLNEKGAILKSEAVVALPGAMMIPGHFMAFDRPFLILLKQKTAKEPYFALWIGNASLLIPAAAK